MFVPSATPCEALAHLFTTAADSDPLNTWNILDNSNTNLTNSQKELLTWHYTIGHLGFDWLRHLMTPFRDAQSDTQHDPIIPSSLPKTRT
eukprot:14450636-Ditylum_brightwellii.AAC.1